MDAEIRQLNEMGTWEEAELPVGRKAVGCRWVFLRKRDEEGKIIKYKARLVFLKNLELITQIMAPLHL